MNHSFGGIELYLLVLFALLFALPVSAQQQTLVYSPTSLTFSYSGGASQPPTQDVSLALEPSGAQSVFESYSTEVPGQTWLRVVLVTTTPGKLAPNSRLAVSVDASGLPNGTYRGEARILFPFGGVSNSSIGIPVTLTVSGGTNSSSSKPTVLFSTTQLSFPAIGKPNTSEQTLSLSTNLPTSVAYTLLTSDPWISLVINSGTTPQSHVVRVTPPGPTGSYVGRITLIAPGAANDGATMTVTYNNAAPAPSASPSSLYFAYTEGGALPAPQALTISNPTSALYEISVAGSWITVSPSAGTTPATITVSVNPGGYTPQSIDGAVRILVNSNFIIVPVSLTISRNSSDLKLSDWGVIFDYQKGKALPAPRTIGFTAVNGLPLPYTAHSLNPWVSITPGTGSTPTPVQLNLVESAVAAMAPGSYNGNVAIDVPGALNPNAVVPVLLRVSDGPVLITPTTDMVFNTQPDSRFAPTVEPPSPQTRLIDASSGSLAVSATVEAPANTWLRASLDSSVTPATLTVSVSSAGLRPGTYLGNINVVSPAHSVEIPVVFTVGTTPRLNVSQSELHFTTANRFAPQTVRVSVNNYTIPYSVAARVDHPTIKWLSLSTAAAITPTTFTVTVDSSLLPPGTHYGSIVIVALKADQPVKVIPVTLFISGDSQLRASPNTLSFTQTRGAPPPAPKTVEVTSDRPLLYRSTTTIVTPQGSNWLIVSQPQNLTNGPVDVSLSPVAATLPTGSYNATITISGPDSPFAIPIDVKLTVLAEPALLPTLTGWANAASYQTGAIAPGMLITFVGRNLGPARGVAGEIVNGRFTTAVAGVWAFFDGTPAPILYASDTQINAVVPYALAGRASTQLTLQNGSATSAPVTIPLTATSPGIFTVDGRQAAALNQDGTVNSPANPAAPGSVIVLYLTGEGALTPNGLDGEIVAATNLRKPIAAARVRVNGTEIPAGDLLYAGSAPGLVSGLMQINLRLPAVAPPNAATPVEVSIGSAQSPVGVTIAVR